MVLVISSVQIWQHPSQWIKWVMAFLIGQSAANGWVDSMKYAGLFAGYTMLPVSALFSRDCFWKGVCGWILYPFVVFLGLWNGLKYGLTVVFTMQVILDLTVNNTNLMNPADPKMMKWAKCEMCIRSIVPKVVILWFLYTLVSGKSECILVLNLL